MAQTSVTSLDTVDADRNLRRFQLEAGTSSYSYTEPGLMKIDGRVNRVGVAYRRSLRTAPYPLFIDGEASYALGNLTYDGSLVNIKTGQTRPKRSPSKDQIFNFESHFGFTFLNSSFQSVDTYAGVGIWNLNNSVEGEGSYDRQTNYYYLPVGLRYNVKMGSNLNFYAGGQFNLLLLGIVNSKLSQANSKLTDIDTVQSSGNGVRAKIGMEFSLVNWSLFTEGYYQYWDMEDSSSAAVVVDGQTLYFKEPANETRMLGINVGGRF